jgi:hypothetical protein
MSFGPLLTAVLLISLCLSIGCSEKRDLVRSKVESIRLGMTKEQVEQILGKPSVIQTRTNQVGSTWLAGIAEEWEYWADDAGRVMSKRDGNDEGAISFDAGGKAQYVFAGAYRLEPPRQPIGRELVEHWKEKLTETYNTQAREGQVAMPANTNAILAWLRSEYRYPDYSNEPYSTMIDAKTASGRRVSYLAELSREQDPWSRTWTFKLNAAFDTNGNMIPGNMLPRATNF